MKRIGSAVGAALLALACATPAAERKPVDQRASVAAGVSPAAPHASRVRPHVQPFDEPQAAEEYARMKRLAGAGAIDPRAAWDRAVARRAAMRGWALAREHAAGALADSSFPARWESVGPGNIGGRTRVLLVDPADPSILYAAGVSGGVFKSVDEGASWHAAGDNLANIAVNALVMDPADPRILYAGTGEGYFREEVRGTWLPLRGGGIFVSTDGAATWTRLPSTLSDDFHWVNDLAISAGDPSRIYAATRTGVWRSGDRGATWTRVLDPAVNGGCFDLAMRPGAEADFLFVSCGTFAQATVHRNRDAGGAGAWEAVLTRAEMGRTTLAIAPSNPDVVYALAASIVPIGGSPPAGLFAVFRSAAAGEAGSWEIRVRGDDPEILHRLLLTNPIAALGPECFNEPRQWVTMGWYCNVIAVDPRDADTVWVGGVDLFRSDDGGRTFAAASWWAAPQSLPAYVHADQHGITFHPQFDGTTNRTMYVANDGGVFRTHDARMPLVTGWAAACEPESSAAVWESLNRGFGATQFYHGAVYPDGAGWIGGTQDNGTVVGREEWGPDGWRRVFGGDGGYVAIDPTDPRRIWVEVQGGFIFGSADDGAKFAPAYPQRSSNEPTLFITPFTLDPFNPQRLWTGGARLWRTDNGGVNWQRASVLLPDLVSAIAVSPYDPELVLAGTSEGRILRTASGSTATQTTAWSGGAPRAGFVSSIAFDPRHPDVAYATYAGFGGAHVWRSSDRGATWTAIDGAGEGELPDIPVHAIVVDPRDSLRLYIGSDLGVFVSLDGGAQWMAEREGMPAAVTEALALSRSGGRLALHAFTHGRGVWRVDLGPLERRRPARR